LFISSEQQLLFFYLFSDHFIGSAMTMLQQHRTAFTLKVYPMIYKKGTLSIVSVVM